MLIGFARIGTLLESDIFYRGQPKCFRCASMRLGPLLSARAARRKSLLSPVFKSVNAVSVNASRHALMLMTTCSSAVRASHSSRESARLTQRCLADQPSHLRTVVFTRVFFSLSDVVLPRGLTHRSARAQLAVEAEGGVGFGGFSGAAVPGVRGVSHGD